MELTVEVDPVTGTWRFVLDGHTVAVEPQHGYVKIDGRLHTVAAVQGLHDITELDGAPLQAIERLIDPAGDAPGSTPSRAAPPPMPTPAGERKPAPRKQRPRSKTPACTKTSSNKPQQTTQPEPSGPRADVVDTKGAARHLGLSPATLTTMRTRGGGPPFVKLGRRVVYRVVDLDAWLADRVRKSTSDPGKRRK